MLLLLLLSFLLFLLKQRLHMYSVQGFGIQGRCILYIDCHTSERFSAIKPGSINYFLHLKMSVPSQEYDSCPFV